MTFGAVPGYVLALALEADLSLTSVPSPTGVLGAGSRSLMVRHAPHRKTLTVRGYLTKESHAMQLPVRNSLSSSFFPLVVRAAAWEEGSAGAVCCHSSSLESVSASCGELGSFFFPAPNSGKGWLMERECCRFPDEGPESARCPLPLTCRVSARPSNRPDEGRLLAVEEFEAVPWSRRDDQENMGAHGAGCAIEIGRRAGEKLIYV